MKKISVEAVKDDILALSKGTVVRIIECPITVGAADFIKDNTCVIQAFEKIENHTESVFYLGYVGTEVAPDVRESYAKEIARFGKDETDSVLSGGIIEQALFTSDGLVVEIDYWGTRKKLKPYDFSWMPLGEWSRG
jgi:hypothetical protein